MPQRSRVSPAGSPKALAVVAAAVLIVALVVTGRLLSGRGTRPATRPAPTAAADAPSRIGDRIVCPLGRPVLATSDGRSYPPGHPARPPRKADPVACYHTTAQAAAAGYPPAPLPTGVLEIGGVYLLPTTGQLRRQCRQAAGRLGFVVPCPMLLPTPAPNTTPPTLCERRLPCTPEFGLLFEEGGFVVPPGYVGVDPATGARLAIGAAKQVTALPVACAGEQPAGGVMVRGLRGRLFECPPGSGPHRGSVLLRWREQATIMAVSVNGHTDLNRRLVLALAAHLELVLPAT